MGYPDREKWLRVRATRRQQSKRSARKDGKVIGSVKGSRARLTRHIEGLTTEQKKAVARRVADGVYANTTAGKS